ncbi:tetratricopeptide repeat protein [Magnetospirillum sp. SS-4]|uniref:O-linked N-acetylglucosamine transferase, SPINDLY family protein n=1 Tax=Magnetospirillum sp. SS-4 TaxID=2681465 RepID=UPI00137F99A9|nr:tetratricopeptide repeat protein [Magnetospirillum sp. SS-4]CAA7620153.1 putative TPR repeat-containing protein [Magnetospirillum sp. SS-4]
MPGIPETLAAAIDHHNSGRFSEAEILYRRILEESPNHADSLHLLGLIAYQHGRFGSAVPLYRQAIAVAGDHSVYHQHLAMALHSLGQMDEAIAAFRAALSLSPDDADIYNNLANLLQEVGRLDEALVCRQRALAQMPDNYLFRHNCGSTLELFARYDEAESWYRSALEIQPDFTEGYNSLGELCRKTGRTDQAIAYYQQALALQPDHISSLNNLGLAYKEKGLLHEAAAVLNRCIALEPGYFAAQANLGTILQQQGRIDEAIDRFQRALRLNPDHHVVRSNLIFALTYQDTTTGVRLRDEAVAWDRRQSVLVPAETRPFANTPDPDRPLRVGFVSADLRDHAVSYFLLPLFRNFDRSAVSVHCYNEALRDDVVTDWFRSLADGWCDSRGIHDNALLDKIRADGIDILIDCSGHSGGNRLRLFKRRPAPVQISTPLGHGGTSGVTEMDYFLSDIHLTPDGYDGQFSERLLRLPRVFAPFEPKEFWPAPAPAVPEGMVFGCFADPLRVGAKALNLWRRLLDSVPGSRLLFKNKAYDHQVMERHWRGRFSVLGDRIDFEGLPGYWASNMDVYGKVRVMLDSCPSTGATSTLIPMWMGVPVMSLAGTHVMERFGAPFLRNAGLGDLVADGEDAYLATAAALIRDETRLAFLRAGLRRTMADSALLDGSGIARDWEAALRQVWREWCVEGAR